MCPEAIALKHYEEEVVDSLLKAELDCLSRQALEVGVIPQNVRDDVESIDWGHVPRERVIRYLLMHVYRAIEESPTLYERWLHVLSNHIASIVVLDKVRQRYLFCAKRPQPLNVFTEQHIPILTDILAACAGKWREMSIFLGLSEHVMYINMSTSRRILCLNMLLREWIVGNHSYAKEPTLKNLENALRSQTVGLGSEANQLLSSLNQSWRNFDVEQQSTLPKELRREGLPLEIVSQSRDTIVAEGKSTLLEVQAGTSHGANISYRWLKDGSHLDDSKLYNNILCIRKTDLSSSGIYACEVSDGFIACSSRLISLYVNILPVKKVLVDRYLSQPEVPADSWPPAEANTCINLALIKPGNIEEAGEYARNTIQGNMDDIMIDKESIEYDAVFTSFKRGTRLLIEGRPGSGKTTLVHRFSQDWASGSPNLNLNNIKLLFLVHLRGFFNAPHITLRDIMRSYYNSRDRDTVDTIIREAEESSGEGLCFILDGLDAYRPKSMINTFICKLIKKLHLPNAVVIITSRPAASAQFRNIADKKVEVLGFLKEQIHEYVEKYPFFEGGKRKDVHKYLEQHPNVHHMCYLPIHAAMVCFLFNVMGGNLPLTETEMYDELMKQTLLRTLTRNGIDSLKSPEDLPEDEKELFLKICELGFEKTVSSKQVMREAEVSDFFRDVHSGNESMGLITVDCMARKSGFENLYTFLHLTFQEYLAAYHVFKLSEAEQLKLLREYGNKRHMQVVWKFYCGLTSFEERDIRFHEIMKSADKDDLFGVQCAFESQQSTTCNSVVRSEESGALSFQGHLFTPPDLTAIGYVLKNATCTVEKLVLDRCELGFGGMNAFLDEAGDIILSIKTLQHSRTIRGPNLEAKALAASLQHCSSLQTLVLEQNGIGADGAKALAEGLQHCSNLQTLNLGGNIIGFNGAKALATSLWHCSSLQTLILEQNGIGNDGAMALAEGLQHCSNLQTLNLGGNIIGTDGAKALAEGLQHCSNLRTLNLVSNHISTDDTKALAESLQHCNILWVPNLGKEAELAKAIEEAIARSGEITRRLAHSIFIGPPGSGKSSLMDRLLHKLVRKGFRNSTAVCKDVVIVDINPSTIQFACTMVNEDTWEEVKCEVSFLKQMTQERDSISSDCAPFAVCDDTAPSTSEVDVESGTSEDVQNLEPEEKRMRMDTTVVSEKRSSSQPQVKSSKIESVAVLTVPKRNVLELIKKHGIDEFRNYLAKTSSLYLRDCGGQVEFQEMLPLIISGPSIYFFVFRADQDFKSKFSIEYRKSERESLNCYTSSITIEEALLQCLASVHAMDISDKSDVKTHQPFVFIVGTHVDQIQSSADENIAQLNQHIDALIVKHGFKHLVEYHDRNRGSVIFQVDNVSGGDAQFKEIRSKVNSLIWGRDKFAITYPVNYLLVCLDLQNVKKNILTISEFRILAAEHNVEGNEVFHLLHFLHLRVGIVRYYDVDGLRHIVVIQPQVLFNAISDLVLETYSCKAVRDHEALDFMTKGIITPSVLKCVIDAANKSDKLTSSALEDGEKISPEDILELLVHLRIITPFNAHQEKKYFIPCVLKHVPEARTDNFGPGSRQIVIGFQCSHCPKGVFGILVTHLMTPDLSERKGLITTTFELIPDEIFRNQVSLEVRTEGVRDKVSLKVCSAHLELCLIPDLAEDRVPIGLVCQGVREVIMESIDSSLKDLHYSTEKVKPEVRIKCCNEGCTGQHPIMEGPKFHRFYCDLARKSIRLPPLARCWYNETSTCPPKYVLDPDYVEAAVGESPTIHFTVTSDPPLAEDVKHVLTDENGKAATKRFRIEGNCITFRNVRLGDSGVYTISCCNEAGLVGKETLELDITPANHPTPSGSQPERMPTLDVSGLTQLGIIKKVSSQWRTLGVCLGQSMNALDNYERKEMLDNIKCCMRVFDSWINSGGTSGYPLCWKSVYDVLCAIGHQGTAEDVKSALARSGVRME